MIRRTKRTKLEELMIFRNLSHDCFVTARKPDLRHDSSEQSWSEEQSETGEANDFSKSFSSSARKAVMQGKNIGEDGDSFEIRDKCFPLSFL